MKNTLRDPPGKRPLPPVQKDGKHQQQQATAVPLTTSYPKTGLKVVVVGAGFGGLSCAVECHLKGHEVVVLEKMKQWDQLGDVISISEPPIRPGSPPSSCTNT